MCEFHTKANSLWLDQDQGNVSTSIIGTLQPNKLRVTLINIATNNTRPAHHTSRKNIILEQEHQV